MSKPSRAALIVVLCLVASVRSETNLPKIPPLPPTSWPATADAEPFARQLMARVPPAQLAVVLRNDSALMAPILRNLGSALMTTRTVLRDQVAAYVTKLAVSTANASKPDREVDVQRLVAICVIDPLRYGADAAFRARIDASLPTRLELMPAPMAHAALTELTRSADLSFDVADRSASAAKLTRRRSTQRRIDFNDIDVRIPDDHSGPIEASIFSLNSSFFSEKEAQQFIDAVHAASPRRRIIVLTDYTGLRDTVRMDTLGRPFTPWPRDPFIVSRDRNGQVVLIDRPNAQPKREEDQNMVRAIVASTPASLDASWKIRWTVGSIPFHNGHILLTPDTVWISMHAVAPRALSMLGLEHLPASRDDVIRFIDALHSAALELEHFYKRPVRFVHPLSADVLDTLNGGAGFDLDSIVTILPPSTALVGDITLGIEAGRRSPVAEWNDARRAYHLRAGRDDVLATQSAPATKDLQRYLDLIANDLARQGMHVRRLPLLNIPTSLVELADVPQDSSFLLTWNNVVLDEDRAEGFASLLTSIDSDVRKTFAESGYELTFFPPLTHSVVLGGGYRCASNHVRPQQKTLSPPRRREGR